MVRYHKTRLIKNVILTQETGQSQKHILRKVTTNTFWKQKTTVTFWLLLSCPWNLVVASHFACVILTENVAWDERHSSANSSLVIDVGVTKKLEQKNLFAFDPFGEETP